MKIGRNLKKFKEITKQLERVRDELEKSFDHQSQIEADLLRQEELNELFAETENALNQATLQKTKAEALLKSNNEMQQELQQMRELLGEDDARCPVCRQEMHGKAHAEAVKYYDNEEQKIELQNAEAQIQVDNAKTIIKQQKVHKKSIEDDLGKLSNTRALEGIQAQIRDYKQQMHESKSTLEQMTGLETRHQDAENALSSAKQALETHDEDAKKLSEDRTVVIDKISEINSEIANLPSQKTLDNEQQKLDDIATTINEQQQALASLDNLPNYDEEAHNTVKAAHKSAIQNESSLKTKIEANEKKLLELEGDITKLKAAKEQLGKLQTQANTLEKHQNIFSFVRKTIRDAGPRIRERKVRLVSEVASNYFHQIIEDYTMQLKWDADDYGITIEQSGEERPFAVLSGGEQMIAALSVRLALLTHLTKIRVIFLDEPTINLDENRRVMLSTQLSKIQDLHQLFVISHDDTFVEASDRVIKVTKEKDVSLAEVL